MYVYVIAEVWHTNWEIWWEGKNTHGIKIERREGMAYPDELDSYLFISLSIWVALL